MDRFVSAFMPNMIDKFPKFFEALCDTLLMVAWAGIFSLAFGTLLGIVLVVCKKGGILESSAVFQIVDKAVNFFRSIPFIILLACLIDLTRFIMGTAIGVRDAIVPLIFVTTPFYAGQIESALSELDAGLVEAAQSMGDSPLRIIFRVYLREGASSIARVTTITLISLIGLTAMAGAVGSGGIGDFAIRYGYNRHQTDVAYFSVAAIVILVYFIQMLGSQVVKRTKH